MAFPFDASDALPPSPRAAKVAALRAATQPPAAPRTPPRDTGERLATIPRGESDELRVAWASYEGRPYLSLRLWVRNARGEWWPDPKRGISVRVRELADFATAVDAALEPASG